MIGMGPRTMQILINLKHEFFPVTPPHERMALRSHGFLPRMARITEVFIRAIRAIREIRDFLPSNLPRPVHSQRMAAIHQQILGNSVCFGLFWFVSREHAGSRAWAGAPEPAREGASRYPIRNPPNWPDLV